MPTQGLTPLETLRLLAMSSGHALGRGAGSILAPLRPHVGYGPEMQMPAMYILSPQDKLRYMASATPLQAEGRVSEREQQARQQEREEPAPDKLKEER